MISTEIVELLDKIGFDKARDVDKTKDARCASDA